MLNLLKEVHHSKLSEIQSLYLPSMLSLPDSDVIGSKDTDDNDGHGDYNDGGDHDCDEVCAGPSASL